MEALPWVYVDNTGGPRALPLAQESVLPCQERQTERSPPTVPSQLFKDVMQKLTTVPGPTLEPWLRDFAREREQEKGL